MRFRMQMPSETKKAAVSPSGGEAALSGTALSGTPLSGTMERLDRAKRRQIMTGASAVFLDQGFDAASMGEIARKAGVSKGTLYVYFDSKEALFEAIVEEQCRAQ